MLVVGEHIDNDASAQAATLDCAAQGRTLHGRLHQQMHKKMPVVGQVGAKRKVIRNNQSHPAIDARSAAHFGGVAVPLELVGSDGRLLTFLSTVTTFGTAMDVTAAELSIEAFLPADEKTAEALRG